MKELSDRTPRFQQRAVDHVKNVECATEMADYTIADDDPRTTPVVGGALSDRDNLPGQSQPCKR